jgi:hypothetical protein
MQREYCGFMSCNGVVHCDMGYPIIERGRISKLMSMPQVWGIWACCPGGAVRRGGEDRHRGEGGQGREDRYGAKRGDRHGARREDRHEERTGGDKRGGWHCKVGAEGTGVEGNTTVGRPETRRVKRRKPYLKNR